jgi:hypothetical protein
MCNPVLLAVVAAAQATASVVSQTKAANAQNAAIAQQTQASYNQEAVAQAAQENDRMRAARKEQARIKVAAGESGLQLGSGSIEAMLLDNQMQTGLANERIALNTSNQMASTQAEANRMYSNVQKPTLLGAGLQIASAEASGYTQGAKLTAERQPMSVNAANSVTG